MKSDDYHIIKIQFYASKYLLNKWHEESETKNVASPKQHRDRADGIVKFFWEFFEKVTGISQRDWSHKYFICTKECALEYLQEEHDIYILMFTSGVYTYLIPKKDNDDLYKWCIANITNPFEIGKRSHMPNYGTNYDRRSWRDSSMTYDEFIEKYNAKNERVSE